jgi:hypothetical protein
VEIRVHTIKIRYDRLVKLQQQQQQQQQQKKQAKHKSNRLHSKYISNLEEKNNKTRGDF